MDNTKVIEKIVTAVVLGEIFGGLISGPIRAIGTWFPWNNPRKEAYASAEKTADLFDAMNQRICDLEEKIKGE